MYTLHLCQKYKKKKKIVNIGRCWVICLPFWTNKPFSSDDLFWEAATLKRSILVLHIIKRTWVWIDQSKGKTVLIFPRAITSWCQFHTYNVGHRRTTISEKYTWDNGVDRTSINHMVVFNIAPVYILGDLPGCMLDDIPALRTLPISQCFSVVSNETISMHRINH